MNPPDQLSDTHDCCHSAEPKPAVKKAFFCPMCAGIESDVPGTCPKCGMSLERNPSYRAPAVYTCPMHPEIAQDRPGQCPICGFWWDRSRASRTRS